MTDTKQPDALRLAAELEIDPSINRPSVVAELRRLHAENATLQQGYDAARMEIEGLRDRVQELGAMLRENRSKRIVELEAQLEAIGAGGVEPLRSRRCLHQIAEPGVAPEHAAPAVPQDTPEAIDGTIQVLKVCGGFTEQAPVIRQLRRYATLLAALTTQGESHG